MVFPVATLFCQVCCSADRILACTGGHEASKSTRTPKPWTIAHENGHKFLKSRDKTMPLESCTGGHGASKSSWYPKNVDCSPRKPPELLEITSFDDATRAVYRGSRGIENLPGAKNRGL